MNDAISFCPVCMRPGMLLMPGHNILDCCYTGDINITRTRDGKSYHCHGCRAEFDRPFQVKKEAVRDCQNSVVDQRGEADE